MSEATLGPMDALREDDVETMRRTPPEEKARQLFELFRFGLKLRRAALRERHPDARAEEVEAMVRQWLAEGD